MCEAYCWLIRMKILPEISLVFFFLCVYTYDSDPIWVKCGKADLDL